MSTLKSCDKCETPIQFCGIDDDGDWLYRCQTCSRLVALSPPTLMDYYTAEDIRPATRDEYHESLDAADDDGGAGVIDVDGRRCYVAE